MAKILLFLVLLLVCNSFGQLVTKGDKEENGSRKPVKTPREVEDCATLNFHFMELDKYGWETSVLKHVEVFMDEKAFSEENLKAMFKFFSKKYADSKTLVIVVHTNWEQLNLPSDCPAVGLTNQPLRSDALDYHQATYYRNTEREYFRYNPILKREEFKNVILEEKTAP